MALALAAAAAQSSSADGLGAPSPGPGAFAITGWKWASGDDPAWSGAGYDDSAWKAPDGRMVAPLDVPLPGGDSHVFWLRVRIPSDRFAPLAAAPGGAWLLSGMSGCAFEAWANGSYLGSRGTMLPRYDVRRTLSAAFLVPAGLVGTGEDLVLALRCAWPGPSLALPSFSLGDEKTAARETGAHNFWNGGFYTMLAALCVFLGLYFLFIFAFKPEARENLYFSLSLILLAVYFYEMGASWIPFASLWVTAFSKGSLAASVLLLYCFLSLFFRYRERPALRGAAIVLGLLFYVAYFAFAGSPAASDLVFNVALLPIAAVLVYGLLGALACVRRGEKEAIPLLAGIAIGAGFAVHDILYQVSGTLPFAWLQGLTFFSLDAAIFIMLSMRQARLQAEVAAMAGRLEAGRAELESSMDRLVRAGDAVSSIGRELESAVEAASASAEASEGRTSGVRGEAERLADRAREAGELVTGFISSIDVVNERLADEATDVERTAAAAAQLQAGVEVSAADIDRTAAFAASLASLTLEGERAADNLGSAMARVAETARGIQEVVDAVNEFAEQTNLLAMNASIEAAHSGQAGKGFAVIAGEVKKLAASQGERASRISVLAREIGERLSEGGRDTESLRTTLRRIAGEAGTASARMGEAKKAALEQAKASAEVREATENLAQAVSAIRDESTRQSSYSERVRTAVDAMVRGAEEARASAAGIAREGAEIARAVRDLRQLAERSLALTEEMRKGVAHGGA